VGVVSDGTPTPSGLNPGHAITSQEWLPLVYEELRRLAASKLAGEKPGQTLQATALVHEAWLKVTRGKGERRWNDRTHFFAVAAEAMRRILIDNARRKLRIRHGGELERVDLEQIQLPAPAGDEDELLAVHEALDELAALDARKAELVKLRFFVGLSFAEAAEVLEISEITAKRDWAFARAWLYQKTGKGGQPDESKLPPP
jgi:RNA polymerase sigma factor (TIGR02999 family)